MLDFFGRGAAKGIIEGEEKSKKARQGVASGRVACWNGAEHLDKRLLDRERLGWRFWKEWGFG